jgi:hypothetical protein
LRTNWMESKNPITMWFHANVSHRHTCALY